MKALITGVDGFVGGHLAKYLTDQQDTTIVGTTWLSTDKYPHLESLGVQLHQIDLTDEETTSQLIENTRPDHIYHLAGQSFVPESFKHPWETLQNNIHAQLNILHTTATLGLKTRILVVGTADVYGPVSPDEVPTNEQQPLHPTSPYSVSKVAQDMLGLQYFHSHQVAAIRVRPFNQIGPGQSRRFVIPAFASQIAAIEKGTQEPVMKVGNLAARRDFTDVRDMVRAYHLLMQRGEPGEVYNIGSGQAYSIQEILDLMLGMARVPIDVQVDPDRFRPVDTPIMQSDNSKVQAAIGWQPAYTIEQTLADVLAEWRAHTGVQADIP
ncbi:MAG: GDP-mannose 4,6-dehydratase [Anaerolineae bacterium]|nr:GDP-mannose 4,6-dehydratase [Anaerolineae bacterium]